MREEQKIDYGSIHIHKRALADIVASVVQETEGMSLAADHLGQRFLKLFAPQKNFAIDVKIDRDNEVSVEARVCARLGINIPEASRYLQEAIRDTVERMTDIQLKDIHINIQGIKGGIEQ
ncbi:MAG TPA: Asp23/Gls24 family envelope stress response protein [Candidatus Omnitrophota bacterium]|nr:Asp23/Gls24 family envelope stress response protein [Candidatus Omnitrophota bacterium]